MFLFSSTWPPCKLQPSPFKQECSGTESDELSLNNVGKFTMSVFLIIFFAGFLNAITAIRCN